MDKTRLFASELIGTGMLVFVGIGSVTGTAGTEGQLLAISLAFGCVVAVIVAAMGHISGAHINPAVTCSLLFIGKIRLPDAIGYIIAQLAGGVLGAFACEGLMGAGSAGKGVTSISGSISTLQGLGMEVVVTFILVFVIFGTAVDMRAQKLPSLFIGLTVAANILVVGRFTGGSMNPARSFGPALVSGKWAGHWIYWVGPILGGALASLVYSFLFLPRTAAEARPELRPDAPAPGD